MRFYYRDNSVLPENSMKKSSDRLNSSDLLQFLYEEEISKLDDELKLELSRIDGVDVQSMSFVDRIDSGNEIVAEVEIREKIDQLRKELSLLVARPPWGTQATWFVGPSGENLNQLIDLCKLAIQSHKPFRSDDGNRLKGEPSLDYPGYISNVLESDDYQMGMEILKKRLESMVGVLNKGSIPFQRFGYIAHMNWDTMLPGVLGWLVGVLYNQNNIAAEASPVTTLMEIDVSRQLCHMIGFPNTPPVVKLGQKDEYRADHQSTDAIPWGKITCDGSVANIESVWMARNFRYFCLSCQTAFIEEALLDSIRNHQDSKIVPTGSTREKYFIDLTSWELINLIPERFFQLLDRVAVLLSPEKSSDSTEGHAMLHKLIEKRDLRALGMVEFAQRYPIIQETPCVLAPSSRHYSWPKSVTLLGLGSNCLIDVPVGLDGRMNIEAFQVSIAQLVEERRPILLAVSVHGSTVEGAVDDLHKILEIRDVFREKGVDFLVHVDAAWGGYFTSVLNAPPEDAITLASTNFSDTKSRRHAKRVEGNQAQFDGRIESPIARLKPSIKLAFEALKRADSITLDPHKSGYIPYPAGGLLLRDSRLRERIAVRAPIVYKGDSDPTVSWYGLEGSRAGAAAIATWFTHQLVPLDQQGYGEILGKCLFNSSLIFAGLHYMAAKSRSKEKPDTAYFVTTIPKLDNTFSEISEFIHRLMTEELSVIKSIIEPEDRESIDPRDRRFREFIEELGSDTAIIAYVFTPAQYIGGEFFPNPNAGLSNKLNRDLYDKYSLLEYLPDGEGNVKVPELFLSSTNYAESTHGADFMEQLKREVGVTGDVDSIDALVTTTMNPWLLDAPPRSVKECSPFTRSDTISYILGILDEGIKETIRSIT